MLILVAAFLTAIVSGARTPARISSCAARGIRLGVIVLLGVVLVAALVIDPQRRSA